MKARVSGHRDVAPRNGAPGRSAIAARIALGVVTAIALVAGVAAMSPGAATAPSAGILAVVPGSHLGEYRHGTYPSSGKRTHVGVDVVAPCGAPVLAPAAGTIVDRIASRTDPDFQSLGYMAIVEHPATSNGRVFYSLYLHLQAPPAPVEHVERGEQLGRVGATGRATGCHVHVEIRYFRDRVSPLWKNIYGPGDQRASRHFRENWEDPVTFIARLERERKAPESQPQG